jgi:SAM-dependent methyltransferase
LALVLREARRNWRWLAIHECAPASRGISVKLRRNCLRYVASNFFPAEPAGAIIHGLRNENLERQTFRDGSFDVVVTIDVFEHLFDPAAAMREIHRTLKPGGVCISAFPMVKGQADGMRLRARRGADGAVEHFEPAEYHGNPIDPEGSLVTVDYGYDVHKLVGEWAAFDARVVRFADRRAGILGELTDVLVCEKRKNP